MKVACLLLAAGRGTRFGGPVPKPYLQLGDRPVLVHSAERLARAIGMPTTGNQLVIVAGAADEEHLAPWRQHLGELGDVRFCHGGDSRQESMRLGLAAADDDVTVVAIHDAARALLPIAAMQACVEAATITGAALLAMPAADTIKRVDDDLIVHTVDRSQLWLAQTPQVIRRELLQRALDHAAATNFIGTDDVSLVEHLGEPVAVVPGSPTNLKITRPEDLPLAAAILAADLA
ncbi:MAG: 2-C-methyl-D-erythritol 4-phosphate cytidylyltransferase [bacterium]|nr:2-C-methyl-D-erythritol 4-phosphate cytidylyltransferase [bacterium]